MTTTARSPQRYSYLPKALDGALDVDPSIFKDFVKKIAAISKKPRIQIGYSSSAMADVILQKVQNDLKHSLGLEVDLQSMEWKFYLAKLKADAPQIYYEGMGAPFNGKRLNSPSIDYLKSTNNLASFS